MSDPATKLRPNAGIGIVIGVTELAWMFERSRDWARALLERWEDDQRRGGPVRVFRTGRLLHTTMPTVHANMPPGKDLALYRRMDAVEADAAHAHQRIDRLAASQGELGKRVSALEVRRPVAGARGPSRSAAG